MKEHRTRRYRPVLQQIVDAINNSHHRSLGLRPSEVGPQHRTYLRNRFYQRVARQNPKPKIPFFAFEVGQLVRIKLTRAPFHVSYKDQYSPELFKVVRRLRSTPPTYELATLENERIVGMYYEAELLHVTLRPPPSLPRDVAS